MTIEDDLARIGEQEAVLVFDKFGLEDAWRLGETLRRLAAERSLPVAIEVRFHSMPAFYSALPGSKPDNEHWIRRKRSLVLRLFTSSYGAGRRLTHEGKTMEERLALSSAEYTAHGGSFPIVVAGLGCIGAVTVSGLPQRADHELVVEALCIVLGKDYSSLKLA